MGTGGEVATRYGIERWREEGAGPPVLLLHGIYAGAGAHEFRELLPRLTRSRCVRTGELLGFGESDRPAIEFTREVVLEATAALIDAAPADATIVASSLTGAYALAHVARAATPRPLVLLTPTGLGKTQSGRSGVVGAAAEVALRRTPFGDVFAAALTSRPSVCWFLQNQAYSNAALVDGATVDAYSDSGGQPRAKYPLVAFVTNRLGYRVDPEDVAHVRPRVVWAAGQRFTDTRERERWAAAGATVVTLASGQPQAEEPAAVAEVIRGD